MQRQRVSGTTRVNASAPSENGGPVAGLGARVEPVVDPAFHLAAIVESSNDAIISKTLDGIITTWNRGAERIFGYPASEVVGQHISILIPPDRADEEVRILAQVSQGERVDHYHTVRRRRDGSLVDISLTVSPIRDAEGRIVGASKIARDITEQVHDQELRRRSEELFRVTLASIADALIATDDTGRITFMNTVAEELTGWTWQDALGRPFDEVFQIINEVTRKTAPNPVAHVLETGTLVGRGRDTILVAKDGTRRPVDDSAAPIQSSTGEVLGVVLVFWDVTERRARALVAERLASIVANSKDAIYTIALEPGVSAIGMIRTWNRAAETLYGYTAAEILGRPLALLIPPDLHLQEIEILARLRGGENIPPYETRRLTRSGRTVDVVISASPLRDSQGRLIGVSKIARAVTGPHRAPRQ